MINEPRDGFPPIDDEDFDDIDRLFDGSPRDGKPGEWELLAAALAVQMTEPAPVPQEFRSKILAAAPNAPVAARPQPAGASWLAAAGWVVAAALLVAWIGPWSVTTTKSFAERRAELLADPQASLKLDWAKSDHPDAKGASGDVVWSQNKQEGFMRFSGLRPNDPTKEQYQLWVFDAERDERYPVDGGVFDVSAGQTEVVVPIRAAIRVGKPALFAVTREKPGGVVVSDRSQLVILAKP